MDESSNKIVIPLNRCDGNYQNWVDDKNINTPLSQLQDSSLSSHSVASTASTVNKQKSKMHGGAGPHGTNSIYLTPVTPRTASSSVAIPQFSFESPSSYSSSFIGSMISEAVSYQIARSGSLEKSLINPIPTQLGQSNKSISLSSSNNAINTSAIASTQPSSTNSIMRANDSTLVNPFDLSSVPPASSSSRRWSHLYPKVSGGLFYFIVLSTFMSNAGLQSPGKET